MPLDTALKFSVDGSQRSIADMFSTDAFVPSLNSLAWGAGSHAASSTPEPSTPPVLHSGKLPEQAQFIPSERTQANTATLELELAPIDQVQSEIMEQLRDQISELRRLHVKARDVGASKPEDVGELHNENTIQKVAEVAAAMLQEEIPGLMPLLQGRSSLGGRPQVPMQEPQHQLSQSMLVRNGSMPSLEKPRLPSAMSPALAPNRVLLQSNSANMLGRASPGAACHSPVAQVSGGAGPVAERGRSPLAQRAVTPPGSRQPEQGWRSPVLQRQGSGVLAPSRSGPPPSATPPLSQVPPGVAAVRRGTAPRRGPSSANSSQPGSSAVTPLVAATPTQAYARSPAVGAMMTNTPQPPWLTQSQ